MQYYDSTSVKNVIGRSTTLRYYQKIEGAERAADMLYRTYLQHACPIINKLRVLTLENSDIHNHQYDTTYTERTI
jgi:hypothetical protein